MNPSTPPPTVTPIPAEITLPLTPEQRAAYQALYDAYESAIEGTTEYIVLSTLNPSQAAVDDILTKDSEYRLIANTALFAALLGQIKQTNRDLKVLKAQIAAIAGHIATAGTIIAAIDKVLSLTAGV